MYNNTSGSLNDIIGENCKKDMEFFDRIKMVDWPLKSLMIWLETFIMEGEFIESEITEALLNCNPDQRYTRNQFRDQILIMNRCVNRLCRCGAQDNRKCATAGYFRSLLTDDNLQMYADFDNYKQKVLKHFFFKLNDLNRTRVKSRIGLLVLYFDNNNNDTEVMKRERLVIMNQLNCEFYVTDYVFIDAMQLFNHTKTFIDAIVIIADSRYSENDLDEYYKTLRQFKQLKIFIVKTEDLFNYDNRTIEDYFKSRFPKNEIIVQDWMLDPEGFPDVIRTHMTKIVKIKIAVSSFFVRNKEIIDTN